MCLWNTDAPGGNKSQNIAKISKSYILTLPHPQGHVMPVKCEAPKYKLTVQVWLLYHHPNFKYFTLFVSTTEYFLLPLYKSYRTLRTLFGAKYEMMQISRDYRDNLDLCR